VDSILVDTNELQTDDIPGKIAALDTVVDRIEVDTQDIQTQVGAVTTHLTDIKGATFSGTTDSLESIRDRGDAAWLTGAGGSAPTVEEIRTEMDDNSTKLSSQQISK